MAAQMQPECAIAVREVRNLLVRHLADLPLASTLCIEVPGIEGEVLWTTHAETYAVAQAAGVPALSPNEYEWLAWAAEAGVCPATALRDWCRAKADDPAARIEPVEGNDPPTWTFGRVLDLFGARLLSVEVHPLAAQPDPTPPPPNARDSAAAGKVRS